MNPSNKADLMTLDDGSGLLETFDTRRYNRQRQFLNVGKLLNCRLNVVHSLLIR